MQGHNFGKSIRNHLIISLVILAIFLCINRVWSMQDVIAGILLLADGLTVTGVLFMIYAFLFKMWKNGYFDGLSYMLYVARYLITGKKKNSSFLNYYDYKSGIEHGFFHLFTSFIMGVVLFVVGLLLVLLFYEG